MRLVTVLSKPETISVLVSLILGCLLVALGFTTFDKYTHMSFAKHYQEGWLSLIDQRVGGGLDLSSYPPLSHQLLALFSLPFGLEAGYNILLMASWLSVSYFSSKFFTSYIGINKPKIWLTFLFVFFSSGILIVNFVFGQLTTIVGLAFGFSALYFFSEFLRKADKNPNKKLLTKEILLSVIALSLCAYAHNLSFIIMAIFFGLLFILEWRLLARNYKAVLLFLVASAVLITPIYYPLLSSATSNSLVPAKEIPHWSRYPLENGINADRWASIFGTSIFMVAFPVILVLAGSKDRNKYIKIYLIGIFFFLLGLGRTTPLSEIFGPMEHWMTYERFALVSSIVFTALFSFFLPAEPILEVEIGKRKLNALEILFVAMFLFIGVSLLLHAHQLFFGTQAGHYLEGRNEMTEYVLSFLDSVPKNYRYQTFGYGRPIGQLYLYSKLPTLDTDYYTGRTIGWLRESGIDEIDQTSSEDFLQTFMVQSQNYSVKYIITFSDYYSKYPKAYGWDLLEIRDFYGLQVAIWENPGSVAEVKYVEEEYGLFNYAWGILPPALLLVFLILLLQYYHPFEIQNIWHKVF